MSRNRGLRSWLETPNAFKTVAFLSAIKIGVSEGKANFTAEMIAQQIHQNQIASYSFQILLQDNSSDVYIKARH